MTEPKKINLDKDSMDIIKTILIQNEKILSINMILVEFLSKPLIYIPLEPNHIKDFK